jgi:hypothetical protein
MRKADGPRKEEETMCTTTGMCRTRKRRKSRTSALAILVQQVGLIIQLLIDLRHDARNGCIDIRGSFHGFDGADGVYRDTQKISQAFDMNAWGRKAYQLA